MVNKSQDTTTSESSIDSFTTLKPELFRQVSFKRRNSDSDDQDSLEDVPNKRGCATTRKLVACPIADFGCISQLPYDTLLEHFSSKIHQETLLKLVEIYVRSLHDQSYSEHSQLNLQKNNYCEIVESLNILAEGISSLHDDIIHIQTNFVQILSNIMEQKKQIEQVKLSTEETSQMFHAMQVNNTILQTEVESVKQMLSGLPSFLSNDGSYIWKITNIAEKIADAIADRQTSIYSPPFYSSATGYKMCMRLYLNGDGQARRTHLSLFFVLLRGDYDAILTWPFHYKITFCLYDQTDARRHIIDSFRPDVKSNSFQRPRSNMNIASGIPKFLPLSIIQQENNPYVRDDCMFIRCIVDFASLPKMIIPFAVNLNPGLPSCVQENMLQTEIQKRRLVTSTNTSLIESSAKTDDLKLDNLN